MGGSREDRFWEWFLRNQDELFSFEENAEEIFAGFAKQLKQVHTVLTFEIGPVTEGKRDLVISADGIREGFPAVAGLVQAAPRLEQWNLIAFRPPRDIETMVHMGEASLGPDDVWFATEPDGPRIGLFLYVRGFSPEREERLSQMVFLLLDNALGEHDVETKIGFVECRPLPSEPQKEGLKPFREIRSIIGRVVH